VLAASAASGNPLSGLVDPEKLGLMGHSLGGKLSVLAASMDNRVDAVLGLDPVDSAMLCNPTQCPDASDKLPLAIPTAFLGETVDSSGGVGGQACAPKADNFETFYAAANSPSIQVTLLGANHMSFLDDPASCGITCSFCNPATLAHDKVLAITRAYTVSFFQRYLKDRTEYDTYLTGDEAQKTWVATSQIQLVSK
jgi:dienelactone hydrolase